MLLSLSTALPGRPLLPTTAAPGAPKRPSAARPSSVARTCASAALVAAAFGGAGSRWRRRPCRRAAPGSEFTLEDGRRTVLVLPNEEEVIESIAEETALCACTAIEEKGAFSLCVPGSFGPKDGKAFAGAKLIAKSLQLLSQEDLQFDKWHVFFAGERLDSQESFLLAKEHWIDASKIPTSQVHPVPQMPGVAEGAAAQYTAEICMQDESVLMDSDEGLPALDLLLLDMAPDGTVGRLRPNSSEVKELGTGKLILPIEEAGNEAAIAAPDFMNAARCVVLVATGSGCAQSVSTALGDPSPSCPASLVRPQRLTWLLDAESAASV